MFVSLGAGCVHHPSPSRPPPQFDVPAGRVCHGESGLVDEEVPLSGGLEKQRGKKLWNSVGCVLPARLRLVISIEFDEKRAVNRMGQIAFLHVHALGKRGWPMARAVKPFFQTRFPGCSQGDALPQIGRLFLSPAAA